jgi:hypothetical protein
MGKLHYSNLIDASKSSEPCLIARQGTQQAFKMLVQLTKALAWKNPSRLGFLTRVGQTLQGVEILRLCRPSDLDGLDVEHEE